MFSAFTYQDWQEARQDRTEVLQNVVSQYKVSEAFSSALTAELYYNAENVAVSTKTILEADIIRITNEDGTTTRRAGNKQITGNRVYSNFFSRFVNQQAEYLLANGVTLDSEEMKKRLGVAFDTRLAQMGQKALVHGVCWGYWNNDHIEIIPSCTDRLSGAFALLDELTGTPRVFIQFWQLTEERPMYIRLFEDDGITIYKVKDRLCKIEQPKRAYVMKIATDARGENVIGESNYSVLPVVPLYANNSKHTELTNAIKSKIDLYDRIASDFGDNLDRANDIYWVLNNFGGNTDDILLMLKQIHDLKAVANISDGTGGGSTAEPKTFEVPYNARQVALSILEKQLYSDYMALSMDEITGGSLTNVAIKTACMNLNLKADAFEWQVFNFVQQVLNIVGIKTEKIAFNRSNLVNDSEIIENIYKMRDDIDTETALKLNPYIEQDDIPDIMKRLEEQQALMMERQKEMMQQEPEEPEEPEEPAEGSGNK